MSVTMERHALYKVLLHPSPEEKKKKHKKKTLVQSLNPYFINVKCPGYCEIAMVVSRGQAVVLQAESHGCQRDAPPGRSSIDSSLIQDEWKMIPINTLCILKSILSGL